MKHYTNYIKIIKIRYKTNRSKRRFSVRFFDNSEKTTEVQRYYKYKNDFSYLLFISYISYIYIHIYTYYLLAPQHFLYFLPLPQGQGSFLPTFSDFFTVTG